MRNIALDLHQLLNKQKRFSFPFQQFLNEIPKNGIYIIFEKGEKYNDLDRIVRVGTHTGNNQLPSRLNQHFVKENKNRSIFRKNIGRCLLNKDNNTYLSLWELDTTSRVDKQKNLQLLDKEFEKEVERRITEYVQSNLSFCVLQIDDKEKRLFWERKIVSTLAKAGEIKPSDNWLGNYSPKYKIKKTGLWQVNELDKDILTENEFEELKSKFLGEIILFKYGVEGGGGSVIQLLNNTVIEKGSSGGMLEEEEDPIINWRKPFESWEAWWKNFIDEHKDFWIKFYPIYIHESIKPFIRNAVKNYNTADADVGRNINNWMRLLDKGL